MAKDYRVSSKPAKKKPLGHCQRAVQQDVTSVNKHVKLYKLKIVYATVSNNGSSINWRADWSRFKGKTYAQVLQSNICRPCESQVQTFSKLKANSHMERKLKQFD